MASDYLSDMVRPYGLGLHTDELDRGDGHSYGEMAGSLIPQTVPADQPVDLLVLAFAVHDVIPGRSTAAYLSHLCPGEPTAFAVCDQGAAAPFTALELIRAYAGADGCRRVLLAVAEQATVPYDLAEPAAVAARHAAVTLLFGESGPASVRAVRQHADVEPARVSEMLGAEIAALPAAPGKLTLIAGNGLASVALPAGELVAADQVLIAPAGQPCTGVWWELAGGVAGWAAAARRVLLADYDRALRYFCVSAIDFEASPAPAVPSLTARLAQ
jgi:4-hydroxymandelate oxidase